MSKTNNFTIRSDYALNYIMIEYGRLRFDYQSLISFIIIGQCQISPKLNHTMQCQSSMHYSLMRTIHRYNTNYETSRYACINYFDKCMFLLSAYSSTGLLRSKLFTFTDLLFIAAHRIILLYPQAQVNVCRHTINSELLRYPINVKDK